MLLFFISVFMKTNRVFRDVKLSGVARWAVGWERFLAGLLERGYDRLAGSSIGLKEIHYPTWRECDQPFQTDVWWIEPPISGYSPLGGLIYPAYIWGAPLGMGKHTHTWW